MMEVAVGTVLLTSLLVALGGVVMALRSLFAPARKTVIFVNGTQRIEADGSGKLLGALAGAGFAIPSACAGAGTCGLCRVRVSGAEPPLPTERARLSRLELRAGTRLACQVGLRQDLQVQVPAELLAASSFSCRVVSNTPLSPLIREIVLEVPEGQAFEPRAGAYVQVTAPAYRLAYAALEVAERHRAAWDKMGLGGLVASSKVPETRAYSLANRPEDARRIVLFIRLAVPPPGVPEARPGVVSSFLFALKPGDSVDVSGPYGHFGDSERSEREMVLIGGGVGMAPLRAIIHDQLERGSGRKISFFYGARSRIDVFHAEEFDDLARRYANFSWTLALSEPAPEDHWDGPTGFVHSVVFERFLKTHEAPEECEYYLCGPPLMIQAVSAMLDTCGVDEESVFADDFGS